MCRKEDVEIESKRSCTVGLHRSRRLLWVSCAALRSGSQTHAPPSRWTVIRGNRSCNLAKPRVASAKIPDALQLLRPKKRLVRNANLVHTSACQIVALFAALRPRLAHCRRRKRRPHHDESRTGVRGFPCVRRCTAAAEGEHLPEPDGRARTRLQLCCEAT
jgi:hypothetical protein